MCHSLVQFSTPHITLVFPLCTKLCPLMYVKYKDFHYQSSVFTWTLSIKKEIMNLKPNFTYNDSLSSKQFLIWNWCLTPQLLKPLSPPMILELRNHQLFSWKSSERHYHLIIKILLRGMRTTLSLYDPRWALQPSLLRPVKLLTHLHSKFLLCATNPINKWCLSSFLNNP